MINQLKQSLGDFKSDFDRKIAVYFDAKIEEHTNSELKEVFSHLKDYVLAGGKNSMELTFGTTAHGAGRMMSRGKAIRSFNPHDVQQEMRKKGIYVKADKLKTLSEENDGAYKNVDDVVEVSHQLGIGTKVVKLKPLGVTKG